VNLEEQVRGGFGTPRNALLGGSQVIGGGFFGRVWNICRRSLRTNYSRYAQFKSGLDMHFTRGITGQASYSYNREKVCTLLVTRAFLRRAKKVPLFIGIVLVFIGRFTAGGGGGARV